VGYLQFLEAISNRRHEDHRMYKEWIGGTWDPEDFHPGEVAFSSPSKRLRQAGLA
jgi:hypothetical protein